jgi:hypothetical protein
LESIWESQPFALLGWDRENGGEFLNFHLHHWLKKHGIHQTRSRPYFKNDQAYVEQKTTPTSVNSLITIGLNTTNWSMDSTLCSSSGVDSATSYALR